MPIRSLKVKDYMSGKLVSFTPETDVLDAIHQLVHQRIAGAPVVDSHGSLVGMLSEFDCLNVVLKAAYHGEPGGPIADYPPTKQSGARSRNGMGRGYCYAHDAPGRMASFSINGVVQAEYKYTALGQQVIRHLTQAGQMIHSVHDLDG